jgi:hypothetical protein
MYLNSCGAKHECGEFTPIPRIIPRITAAMRSFRSGGSAEKDRVAAGAHSRDRGRGPTGSTTARRLRFVKSYTPTRSVCTACRTPWSGIGPSPFRPFSFFFYFLFILSLFFFLFFPVFCFIFSFSFFSQIRKTYKFKKCSIFKTVQTLKLFKPKNDQTKKCSNLKNVQI